MSNFKKTIAEKLKNRRYRHEFFAGRLKDEISTAIRDLRESRNMTQAQLAEAAHMKQSAISRLESASHGTWGIPTLLRLGEVLDARLRVTFVPMEEELLKYTIQGQQPMANNMNVPASMIPISFNIEYEKNAQNIEEPATP